MKKKMILVLVLLTFAALAFAACTPDDPAPTPTAETEHLFEIEREYPDDEELPEDTEDIQVQTQETERHIGDVADVVGVWISPPNPEIGYEEITLNQDGTFSWQGYGRRYGTFTLIDDSLMLTSIQLVSQELGGTTEDIEETREITFDRENQRLILRGYHDVYFTRS